MSRSSRGPVKAAGFAALPPALPGGPNGRRALTGRRRGFSRAQGKPRTARNSMFASRISISAADLPAAMEGFLEIVRQVHLQWLHLAARSASSWAALSVVPPQWQSGRIENAGPCVGAIRGGETNFNCCKPVLADWETFRLTARCLDLMSPRHHREWPPTKGGTHR